MFQGQHKARSLHVFLEGTARHTTGLDPHQSSKTGRMAQTLAAGYLPTNEEEMMAEQVLIVGAGPTGLTAALELSRLGIPVRIIDKQPAPATTSRAIGVQARTLELLEQRGLAEEMVARW